MNHIPKHLYRQWLDEAMAFAALPAPAVELFEKILARKKEERANASAWLKPGIQKRQPVRVPDEPSEQVRLAVRQLLARYRFGGKKAAVGTVEVGGARKDISEASPAVTS